MQKKSPASTSRRCKFTAAWHESRSLSSSDRLPSCLTVPSLFFSPCTRTPSLDPCTLTYLLFSSFSPFNLSVRAYRAEEVKPRINTKYKGTTNMILYLPFSLLLSSMRGKLSRFPLSRGNLFFFHPCFRECKDKRGVPAIDLWNRSQAPDFTIRTRERR